MMAEESGVGPLSADSRGLCLLSDSVQTLGHPGKRPTPFTPSVNTTMEGRPVKGSSPAAQQTTMG